MNIGTCWIYGRPDDAVDVAVMAFEKFKEEGFGTIDDWWFERYHPIRTVEDKKGNSIIDICFFVN